MKLRMAGAITGCIQLLLSIVFLWKMGTSGIFPAAYVVGGAAGILLLNTMLLWLQLGGKKRAVAGVILGWLVIIILGLGVFYLGTVSRFLEDIGSGSQEQNLDREDEDTFKPFHLYISGIDVAGDITKTSRSDVNIIATVNPGTRKILLTTTPRDYYVELPGISGGVRDKLTHAGIYGVDVSVKTLEALYGIDISYYARVNFTSLVTIVDAFGGIDVHSEYEFRVGPYHFQKGNNHLNGEQALAFSRERYSFQEGDNQRGRNQEAVLIALLQKVMSPALLRHADEILSTVEKSVETNFSSEELTKLIRMQLSHPRTWEIIPMAAEGRGDQQPCFSTGRKPLYVMWPEEASVQVIQEKMQEIINEE